jgi:hypothetical protein
MRIERTLASFRQFTRPVCLFSQVPTYRGSGNIDDAASFECAAR